MMPVLLVLVVVIAVYSLTLKNTGDDGVTRTGLEGFLYDIKPDVTGLTVQRLPLAKRKHLLRARRGIFRRGEHVLLFK